MNNAKVNELAAVYATSKCNGDFAELYHEVISEFRKRFRRSGIDPHDAEEAFHDSLRQIANTWQPGDGCFAKLLNIRYKSRVIDRMRKRKRRSEHEIPTDEFSEAATLLRDYTGRTEDYEVNEKVTELGRQAIIDHLLHPTKSDYATSAIVAALKASRFEDIPKLGKAIDIHHEVVKRKLRALSRNYDVNRFGDISDYVAV